MSVSPKKSGLKTFKPGDVLFNEGDNADSLYIIQRGQIRLFRPKGRGFVEIAVLRAGEVIGEMAFFDQKARRRSCSASAMVTTDMVEISFTAFEKTMEGLNPWFKTIINTLADRLRKTNERIKELESNSLGYGKAGKVADYKFFQSNDVIRVLSLIYMAMKTHGEELDGVHTLHMNILKFYSSDIFNVQDVKFEEFFLLLKDEGYLELNEDDDGALKLIQMANPERIKFLMSFLHNQRRADESKKMKISYKCELFIKKIIDQITLTGVKGKAVECDVSAILADFKATNTIINEADLKDAIDQGLCDDLVVGDNNRIIANVNYDQMVKMFPAIKLMNAIERANESKNK
tara:strand:- start:33044 stop:34084 length:1041 start_codon:yes stop_codon:yes gene_type:complete